MPRPSTLWRLAVVSALAAGVVLAATFQAQAHVYSEAMRGMAVEVKTLNVSADTFAARGVSEASIPHDTDSRVWVGNYQTTGYDETQTFMRFDLSDLPPNAEVQRATLRMYLKRATYRDGVEVIAVELRRVASEWPTPLTWAKKPIIDSEVLSTTNVDIAFNNPKSWTVPPQLINDWIWKRKPNYGLALLTTPQGNPENFARSFLSLDGFTRGDNGPGNHPPQLDLQYVLLPPPATPTATSSPTPAGAVSVSMVASGARATLLPGTPIRPNQVIAFTVNAGNTGGLDLRGFHLCADIPSNTTLDRITYQSPGLTPVPTPGSTCKGVNRIEWTTASLRMGEHVQVVYNVRAHSATPTATLTPRITPAPTNTSAPLPTTTATATSGSPPTPGRLIELPLLETKEIVAIIGVDSSPAYGVAYVIGLTELPGPASGLIAQAGFGPEGTDPSVPETVGWQFVSATHKEDFGRLDRYVTVFNLSQSTEPRTYDMAYRFSLDEGKTWVFADTDQIDPIYRPKYAGKLFARPVQPPVSGIGPAWLLPFRLVPARTTSGDDLSPLQATSPQAAPGIIAVGCAEAWSNAYMPPVHSAACIKLGEGIMRANLPYANLRAK